MIIILVIGTIEKDIVVVVTKAVKKNEIYNVKFYIENEEKGPCLMRQIYITDMLKTLPPIQPWRG